MIRAILERAVAGPVRMTMVWVSAAIVIPVLATAALASSAQSQPAEKGMQVACAQIEVQPELEANARLIVGVLMEEAKRGTRLVAFPECSLTTYEPKIVATLTQARIDAALDDIAAACRRLNICAVVGSAYTREGKWYNGAFVVAPTGRIIKRYTKLHDVKDFFSDGNELVIFRVDGVPMTLMICHDERYPEIFRIPVLAGAKVGIYISAESKTEKKWDNYRCQIVARAVENQIAVIHCNAGDGGVDGGSHGHSRIIDQGGAVLAEADGKVGTVIRATIHPRHSGNDYAKRGAGTPSLRAFWAEGLRVLREQNPEYFAEPADSCVGPASTRSE
ncbi:MAG: hypothetical protein HY718_11255 [Planctomycetes bacterium]|nr:hypothetical protein [Planctomycetota bacterium]